MKSVSSREFFENTIEDFFHRAGRDRLPWRKKHITAYEVWVSEIMLQQTQVSRVIDYYTKFLERFPTVETLAKASWEEFLPYYQGLGYYARGRNMLKAAQVVVNEYGGTFPRSVELLDQLPGIGPYTAAAIASFAYGQDAIAWDTNLRRVVGRYFSGTKHVDATKLALQTDFTLEAKTLNAALMDFGSAICVSRPKCANCPLSAECRYFAEQGKQERTHPRLGTKHTKRATVDWKQARVFLTLHENHRKYYSFYKSKFAPFVIPASHNTRAGIKDWFRERYQLELSVRPPHRKEMIDGMPTLFVNAQILSGTPTLTVFSKEAYHIWYKRNH